MKLFKTKKKIQELIYADKLREIRTKAGISLRQLSKAIGVSAPFMSKVEVGVSSISKEKAEKVTKFMESKG